MTVPVLAAVTGASWEAALVAGLERTPDRHHGRTTVRRPRRPARGGRDRHGPGRVCCRPTCAGSTATRWPGSPPPRVAVVGLYTPGDEEAETRLRQLGVVHVLLGRLTADRHRAAVSAALGRAGGRRRGARPGRRGASRWRRCPESRPRPTPGRRSSRAPAGWSRSGGRPARPGAPRSPSTWPPSSRPAGVPTLLADADVYGGVVAQVLGFLDEAPGLAAAARLANNGQLDVAALAAAAPQAAPHLRVLTGISRADRWPELRPSALEQVWLLCRSLAAVTVVDLGFCLEQDEELSFDTAAPRRNGATLATLDAADTVLAVGTADPVGMQRLVRGPRPAARGRARAPAAGGAQPGPARRGRCGARGPARRGAGALRRGARRRRSCRRTARRSTRHCCRPAPWTRSTPARRPASRWPASRPAWSAARHRVAAAACSAAAPESTGPVSRTFPDHHLTTQRLLLRPYSVDDVDAIVSAAGDELIQRWLPLPRPYTREDAVQWCTVQAPEARTSGAGLARAVTRHGRLVGAIDLKRTDWAAGVTGWLLGDRDRQRGAEGSRRRPVSAPRVSPGRRATCTVVGSTWWSTRWSRRPRPSRLTS